MQIDFFKLFFLIVFLIAFYRSDVFKESTDTTDIEKVSSQRKKVKLKSLDTSHVCRIVETQRNFYSIKFKNKTRFQRDSHLKDSL